MADLAELTGAGRIDIFEGYRLAPPNLLDIGECEKEFEAKHLAFARAAAQGQHPDTAEKILNRARDEIASGKFSYGAPHFNAQALMAQNLPFWIYVELRRNHPDVTREKAGELLRDHAHPLLVQDVVLILAGYSEVLKKNLTIPPDDAPSIGTPSSKDSVSSDSPTKTSGDSPSGNLPTPSESETSVPAPSAPSSAKRRRPRSGSKSSTASAPSTATPRP